MEPYLNSKNELSESYFEDLFGALTLHEQYEVIDIMIKNNIGYGITESDDRSQSDSSLSESNEVKTNYKAEGQYKDLLVLSNEQLCMMAQKKDKNAVTALIIKNQGFVIKRAKQIRNTYAYSQLSLDDLYQEGVCGILNAIPRFDVSLGKAFLTYADYYIYQKISRAIVDTGYVIRIPVHGVEQIKKVAFYRAKYPSMNYDELSAMIEKDGGKISPIQIQKCVELSESFQWLRSLNDEIGDEENSELMDFVKDKKYENMEDFVFAEEFKGLIEELLYSLPPRESRIVKEYYGFTGDENATLESVAHKFGVTRERIRQILNQALSRMRNPKTIGRLVEFK